MSPTVSKLAPKPIQVAAAVIGNALEWYDFVVFGSLTVIVSKLFFPADSQYASLLLTTATFGVGFFMRPVGGIVLGIYADRYGRKSALLLIILLMTLAIALIGFAPTYAAVGFAAPLIIVTARMLQGFATGGEFASATSFLIESAPPHRRGFYGSWQMVGQGLAVLIGALLGALLTRTLQPAALDSWGWRVPFWSGSPSVQSGSLSAVIWRRLRLSRTRATVPPSLAATVAANVKETFVCMGLITFGTISFYVILAYMPTFARTQLRLQLDDAFLAQSISLTCMTVLIPLFGALADRIGRKPIMIGALGLYLLSAYPLFGWLHGNPSFASLVTVQIVLCSLLGAFYGPISTAVAEQFATRTRSTGLGIAYNLAVMIFGGFAQFFVTWLIEVTGSPTAPSFYLIFGAAVGLAAAFFMIDRAREVQLPTLEPVTLAVTSS